MLFRSSAQRLALFILSLSVKEVEAFSTVTLETRKNISYCKDCFHITLSERCSICEDHTRNSNQLCIVAEPKDIFAIEKTHEYIGKYHVLGGLISPLDRVYAESLRIKELLQRLDIHRPSEIILAINPTIEGDATLLYLTKLLEPLHIPLTKLAYGLPVGADIDYADEVTLQKALLGRRCINASQPTPS